MTTPRSDGTAAVHRSGETAHALAAWRALPLDAAPYLFPDDRPLWERGPFRRHTTVVTRFADYIASPVFATRHDTTLHLGLLPQPYAGDLERAAVVVLLLNPGLAPADFYAEERDPDFRRAAERSLWQQVAGEEYPFLFLDPRFAWHPGYTWWAGKLASVVDALAAEWAVPRLEAQRRLSHRLASLELVPYHSTSFGLSRALRYDLPSARAARTYASDVLAPRARSGEVTLVVARGATVWGLVPGRNIVVYGGAAAHGAHLTPDGPGGAAIIRALLRRP